MKITQIVETTTSGSVATVATPLFKQSRKGGNLLTGKKTNKKYANSISEGKMKELSMDLKSGKDGLSDVEFKKKYNKTKEEMRKALSQKPQDTKKVDEAKLEEDDLILVPGIGRKLKSGFIPHDKDRTDHEVEMARSDLFQAAKNAKKVYELISNISEEEGLEGWVQEKIIKANDYLNTIREYLEHKTMTREATTGAGVIAGGPQYESVVKEKAVSKAQQRFMGMVHAAQKGEKPASKEVAKAAKTIGKKDAKDFAATKHKGLPEKKKD